MAYPRSTVVTEAPQQDKTVVSVAPVFKLYFTEGDSHICGRAPKPISFLPDETPENWDSRPHALVHRTLGDWLIAEDRRPGEGARYAWADSALAAFEEV